MGTALVAARSATGRSHEDAVVVGSDEADEASTSAGGEPEVVGFWFYVDEHIELISPYDENRTVGTLRPGEWYLAGDEVDDWVYAVDDRGAEGWVDGSAVRRYEG